jgi:hypothetical protein
LRILLTNNTLAAHAGSEVYVRDLAIGLLRRGHDPVVYSSVLGEVAAELARATVPVIDDLAALNAPPDVIHGQHHLDAMTAVLRWPRVPAVYLCHGWSPWQERPPVFPSIRRHLAVDDLCRERLLTTPGIAPGRVEVLLNPVDLARFQPRSALPARPRSALVFSNYAEPGGYADTVVRACRAHGLERVEVIGAASGRPAAAPEHLLREFDLVFAKARCAIEAMAVGCAVIVADANGLGGMVDSKNVRRLRRLNFGARTMQADRVGDASISAALRRYDARDAARVSAFIRADADLDAVVDRLVAIYRTVRAEAEAEPANAEVEAAAASAYVASLAGLLKNAEVVDYRARQLERRLAALEASAAAPASARAEPHQAPADAEPGHVDPTRSAEQRAADSAARLQRLAAELARRFPPPAGTPPRNDA